jgi:hypothetical protein
LRDSIGDGSGELTCSCREHRGDFVVFGEREKKKELQLAETGLAADPVY